MCNLLESRNIKQMHFFGDSYMRHIYIATAVALSNNYKDVALREVDESCRYGNQFSEASNCRRIIRPSITTCDGRVLLHLHYVVPPNINFCGNEHLNFWSEGNHPVNFNYESRVGVNDPVDYQEKFLRSNYGICHKLRSSDSQNCSLFWISTHARHNQKFQDEEDSKVRMFNEQMRMFFESGNCGPGTLMCTT